MNTATVIPTVYLAGPGVFEPNVEEHFSHLKALCAKYGLEGVSPLDNEVPPDANRSKRDTAAIIYKANVKKASTCSAILADVTPFRGAVEPDSGTCVEIGIGLALDKPVHCYSSALTNSLAERIRGTCSGSTSVNGIEYDVQFGKAIEDFDLTQNLMIGVPCPCFTDVEQAIAQLAIKLK